MLYPVGGTIDSNEILSDDAEGSDKEKVQEDDVRAKQQLAEQDPEEDDSFENFLKFLAEKFPILKTREGRAGLVHNFLRGLQLPSAPVPSGKKMPLVHAARETFLASSSKPWNARWIDGAWSRGLRTSQAAEIMRLMRIAVSFWWLKPRPHAYALIRF